MKSRKILPPYEVIHQEADVRTEASWRWDFVFILFPTISQVPGTGPGTSWAFGKDLQNDRMDG